MLSIAQPDPEVRAWLSRYLDGQIVLAHFEEWFVPATWGIADSDLVNEISLLLAEYSSGDRTEEELRLSFSGLAKQPAVTETSGLTVGASTESSGGGAIEWHEPQAGSSLTPA